MAVLTQLDRLLGTDIEFPVSVDGAGRISLVSGKPNLAQAIACWIKTELGETLYMRTKGIGARKYVHMLQSDIANLAPGDIESKLMQWEKRLEWAKVSVVTDRSGRHVRIVVRFKPLGYAIEGQSTVPVIVSDATA